MRCLSYRHVWWCINSLCCFSHINTRCCYSSAKLKKVLITQSAFWASWKLNISMRTRICLISLRNERIPCSVIFNNWRKIIWRIWISFPLSKNIFLRINVLIKQSMEYMFSNCWKNSLICKVYLLLSIFPC